MTQNDDFEQKLIDYFQKNQEVPEEIKEGIRNINLTKTKRSKPKVNLKRIIAAILSITFISILPSSTLDKSTLKLYSPTLSVYSPSPKINNSLTLASPISKLA